MLRDRMRGFIVRNLMWKKAPYYVCNYYDGKLICPPSFAKWMVRPDVWEPESRAYLVNHVKSGSIAIDIGAGVGHYTFLFSRLVGKFGKVYAYEPDPEMFKILQANIQINGLTNVIAKQCAIGNCNGEKSFYISTVGSSSFVAMCGLRTIIKTEVITIDSLNLARVDWVKIDTEGYEAEVIRGMKNTIELHHPKLLAEFIPEVGPVDDLLQLLEGWTVLGLDSNLICQLPKDGIPQDTIS